MVQEAEADTGDVEEALGRLDTLTRRLALHFCESEQAFHLSEFLDSFREFSERVKTCQQVGRPGCLLLVLYAACMLPGELSYTMWMSHSEANHLQ